MNEIVKAKTQSGVMPIIIGSESEEDYSRHKEAVILDLGAVGMLEQMLAGEIALLMWKLKRIDRVEAARLIEEVGSVDKQLEKWWNRTEKIEPLDDIEGMLDFYSDKVQGLKLAKTMHKYSDETPINGSYAVLSMWTIAQLAGVETEIEDDEDELWAVIPGEEGRYHDDDDEALQANWTIGRFKACLNFIAKQNGEPLSLLLRLAYEKDNGEYMKYFSSHLQIEGMRRQLKGKQELKIADTFSIHRELQTKRNAIMDDLWKANERFERLQEKRLTREASPVRVTISRPLLSG